MYIELPKVKPLISFLCYVFFFGPRQARVPGFPAVELARRSPAFGWGQLAVAYLMLLCRTVAVVDHRELRRLQALHLAA